VNNIEGFCSVPCPGDYLLHLVMRTFLMIQENQLARILQVHLEVW